MFWKRSLLPIPFWHALVIVLVLALVPLPEWPETPFSLSDKAQHTLVFAGLWGLGRLAYPDASPYLLSAGLLAYGLLMEGLQGLVPWRQAEWGDLTADAIGVAGAMALWRLRLRLRKKGS